VALIDDLIVFFYFFLILLIFLDTQMGDYIEISPSGTGEFRIEKIDG